MLSGPENPRKIESNAQRILAPFFVLYNRIVEHSQGFSICYLTCKKSRNVSDTSKSVILGETTIILLIKHTQPKISLFAQTKGQRSKRQLQKFFMVDNLHHQLGG